jgi:hypothetical protein
MNIPGLQDFPVFCSSFSVKQHYLNKNILFQNFPPQILQSEGLFMEQDSA